MMLHIPEVLTPVQVADVRAKLTAADWVDGKATVGAQGARVKKNRQLSELSPVGLALGAHPSGFTKKFSVHIRSIADALHATAF